MSPSPLPLDPRPNGALIFCRVIDNFGDAGVTWRLARRFSALGIPATLVIDRVDVLAKLVPELDSPLRDFTFEGAPLRSVGDTAGVTVWDWDTFEKALAENDPQWEAVRLPELVFETFGCRLPDALEARLAEVANSPRHLTYNLEYLSAETWVEDSHNVWGLHPRLPIKKLWFFPGFTDKTGGVIIEEPLKAEVVNCEKTSTPEKKQTVLRALGLHPDGLTFFIFTYPENDLTALTNHLTALSKKHPVNVMLAPGVAGDTLYRHLQSSDTLRLRKMPFVCQPEFDAVLRLADIAIIRGEDSFVRAQLNGKPLLWSIYPTDDQAHLIKLDAWLDRLRPLFEDEETYRAWREVPEAWVKGALTESAFIRWCEALPTWTTIATQWQNELFDRGDLVLHLVARWQQAQDEAQ